MKPWNCWLMVLLMTHGLAACTESNRCADRDGGCPEGSAGCTGDACAGGGLQKLWPLKPEDNLGSWMAETTPADEANKGWQMCMGDCRMVPALSACPSSAKASPTQFKTMLTRTVETSSLDKLVRLRIQFNQKYYLGEMSMLHKNTKVMPALENAGLWKAEGRLVMVDAAQRERILYKASGCQFTEAAQEIDIINPPAQIARFEFQLELSCYREQSNSEDAVTFPLPLKDQSNIDHYPSEWTIKNFTVFGTREP